MTLQRPIDCLDLVVEGDVGVGAGDGHRPCRGERSRPWPQSPSVPAPLGSLSFATLAKTLFVRLLLGAVLALVG